MNIKPSYEVHQEATEKVKEITMLMNSLSEDDFNNKYRNDVNFHKCFDLMVEIFKSYITH